MASDISAFLSLPLEIKYNIYKHLCRNEPVYYPFPNSPITSISHGGPPRPLLLTCRQIAAEAREYYYGLATLRFLSLRSVWIKRETISTVSLAAIQRARKIELMLVWNVTSAGRSAELESWLLWMNGWLYQQVKLMDDEGHKLEVVTISLRDAPLSAGWKTKPRLLEPLNLLKGKVRFLVGEIIAAEDVEDSIRDSLEKHIQELNKEVRSDVAPERSPKTI